MGTWDAGQLTARTYLRYYLHTCRWIIQELVVIPRTHVGTKVPRSSNEPPLQKLNVFKPSPTHSNFRIKASFLSHKKRDIKQPSAFYRAYGPSHLHYRTCFAGGSLSTASSSSRWRTLPCLHAYTSFRADGHDFILKYIHPVNFEDLQEANNRLRGNASHVRLAIDTIPSKSMVVFEHFTDHLLTLAEGLAPYND